MRSQMQILLILLTLLLVPMRLLAQETLSSKASPEIYGLASGQSSPNELVAELLDAAVDEGEKAADKSFNEGYRQGLLDGQPNAAWWESFSHSMIEAMEKEQHRPTWGIVAVGTGAGVLVGFSLGVSLWLVLTLIK